MSWLLSGSRRTIAPHHRNPAEAQRRWRGRGLRALKPEPPQHEGSVAHHCAQFAQEVEQKMSNLLAGFGAARSFLDRSKHCTETQLAAAESSPGASKFESDLPGCEDSNFDVMQADR